MRFLHPSLGLTALVAAFAVGLRTEEASRRELPDSEANLTILPHSSRDAQSSHPKTTSSRKIRTRVPLPDPHLEDLSRTLSLSHTQQADIHPAILRASLNYDPEQPYSTAFHDAPRFLGPPMTRADFEDALFAILNVDQQLDYAASVTEKEAWWNSVISRLEADLESQTSPTGQLPTPPPPTSAPSQGRDRQLQLPPVAN